MESLNHNSSNRSLLEDDENISKFRRRNKILILVFLFLIISSALIIVSLIISLVRDHEETSPPYISPVEAYCYVSDKESCLRTLNPIISKWFIANPNQVFTLSLQTAAKNLQHITSLIRSDSAFTNCSNSLHNALDQIRDPLETVRVNPFVETLSDEQRAEMMYRIMAAEEDVMACLDDLAKVNASTGVAVETAKLVDVKVYLDGARDFIAGYAEVLQMYEADNGADRGMIAENMFGICMCGLQLLFLLSLFYSLCRIR